MASSSSQGLDAEGSGRPDVIIEIPMVKLIPCWHSRGKTRSRDRTSDVSNDCGPISALVIVWWEVKDQICMYQLCPPIVTSAYIGPYHHPRLDEAIHCQGSWCLELNPRKGMIAKQGPDLVRPGKSTLISSGPNLTRGVPSGGPSYTRLCSPGRKMQRKKAPMCHPGLNIPPGHMAWGSGTKGGPPP